MNTSHHTPGLTWYQHQNTIQDNRRIVATLHGSADYINSNAAVMVSGCELLAAAQAIADELEPNGYGGYHLQQRDYFDAQAAFARLNAAIAKATSAAVNILE